MSNTDPLVIVIGAGASKEVNLPIGSELTRSIAESLDFKTDDFGRIIGGANQIISCIRILAKESPGESRNAINDYYRAARKICEAMPLAPSIDNFIDSHRTDKKIAQIGKLAIALCILKAERESSIHFDQSNSYNTLKFTELDRTWFASLFNLLSQHCSRDELQERLSRLTIVSFNYDRCFKHFLREALLTYYSMQRAEAEALISKVSILHPYGSVGQMRFEAGRDGVDYGEELSNEALLRSAEAIKTFTESTDDASDETKNIRESIANAKTLVFLGFAFHPLNLDLLYGPYKPQGTNRDCHVFGTAKGISSSNQNGIEADLVQLGGYDERKVQLRSTMTAGALISEHSRHLARCLHSAV